MNNFLKLQKYVLLVVVTLSFLVNSAFSEWTLDIDTPTQVKYSDGNIFLALRWLAGTSKAGWWSNIRSNGAISGQYVSTGQLAIDGVYALNPSPLPVAIYGNSAGLTWPDFSQYYVPIVIPSGDLQAGTLAAATNSTGILAVTKGISNSGVSLWWAVLPAGLIVWLIVWGWDKFKRVG